MHAGVARATWRLLEPYHAVVYFADEVRDAMREVGLRGFWMGYFAGRAAPMGAAGPELVAATFYNFNESMVRRAIPDAWAFARPERVLEARLAAVEAALHRLLGSWATSAEAAEAAALARRCADACDPAGRPVHAAHRALPWPERPALALWHAATLLREHRGDGHVAALLAARLDGCEAHVTMAGSGAVPADVLRPNRGWSDDDWAAAEARLRDRGLLDAEGAPTAEGAARRSEVERLTDELALGPYAAAGDDTCGRLGALLAEPVRRILAGGAVPYPNPMGVPPPA